MTAPVIVVGGGLAAGHAVTELRDLGHEGEVLVLTSEPHPPYERPPLSKELIRGEKPDESTYLHPAEWYAAHQVDLRTGTTVVRVDPSAHTVETDDGQSLAYSRLLLATGARARRLPLEPTTPTRVCYLRTLDDAGRLRALLGPGQRLLVVGGGWIGMEVAASARRLDSTVTLVEPAGQPLAALGPEVGARFAAAHREHGVDLRTGTGLDRVADGLAMLTDGTAIEVDVVLVGVGAVPRDELARDSGIEVDDGVLVDAGLRTSAPDVFAAGDVANVLHPVLGERVRVEHWQNAISQGRAVAHALAGEAVSYDDLPYFFTDQYDLGLEYFGHVGSAGFDEFVIEDGASDAFACFWSRAGRLLAAMHVNQWDRSDELRDRVREGR